MKNLFKTLFVAILFFAVTEASAQMSAGGGVVYGTNISNVGFSVNGKYEINEKWSAAPAFTYFLKKSGLTWMALDLDANYQITELSDVGSLYGIGGLGLTFAHYSVSANLGVLGDYNYSGTSTTAGLNLGVGLKIPLSEKMAIAPEMKYTINSGGYFRIGAKIMFGL